jgi:hypothetical protein
VENDAAAAAHRPAGAHVQYVVVKSGQMLRFGGESDPPATVGIRSLSRRIALPVVDGAGGPVGFSPIGDGEAESVANRWLLRRRYVTT